MLPVVISALKTSASDIPDFTMTDEHVNVPLRTQDTTENREAVTALIPDRTKAA